MLGVSAACTCTCVCVYTCTCDCVVMQSPRRNATGELDKTASLHVFSDVRRDIRKALHVGGYAKASAAAAGATTTTESGDGSGGSSSREGSGGRANGEHGNTNGTNEIGVASGGVSAKYAVELTRATLDMHLFGPFMGFLYERTFFARSGTVFIYSYA